MTLQRPRLIAEEFLRYLAMNLLPGKIIQQICELLAVKAPLDVAEITMQSLNLRLGLHAVAPFANGVAEGHPVASVGIGHAPMRERSLHRIAQQQDQLDIGIVLVQTPYRRPPIQGDGRGLSPQPMVASGEIGIQLVVAGRLPVVTFVIEEMRFLAARHLDLRVLPKKGVEAAGAPLLRARDNKI